MTNQEKHPYRLLRNKILSAMILAPAIPFVLVVVVGFFYFSSAMERETFSRMVRVAEDHRKVIEMFLAERKDDLTLVASSNPLDQISQPGKLHSIFDTLRGISPAFVDLGVFNPSGVHVAYVGPYPLKGKIYINEPWYKQVLSHGYYISDVFLGFRKVPHFIIAISVGNQDEPWVVRATIDTAFFTDMVEKVRMGKTGEAYIVNSKGIFQTERRSGGDLMETDDEKIALEPRYHGVKTFISENNGETYIYAATWLKGKDWQLIVRQERSDALRDVRTAWVVVALILLAGLAGIVSMGFYLTNKIISRLTRMDSEKNLLNQQLIVASRLAEIGEMSAGFAHEINNPLQIIRAEQALVETILQDMQADNLLPQGSDTAELLDSIGQIKLQIDRCGNITQSILKFARQKETKPQELSLTSFVPEVLHMVAKKAQVGGIELASQIDPDTPPVMADPGQLQQVLLNLLNNAFDAVDSRHGSQGGRIVVGVQGNGNEVLLSVADNGSGISQENMQRIFTPFFTTKPVGQGTGLGLPVCFGIIEQMKGTIEVSSQDNQGSTFTITLPAA